jgi:hypothetical protein
MDRKLVGEKAEPTQEELEFIYGCIGKMSDKEVLEEMQEDTRFPVRSTGFIKRRRKEFNAAKKVLEQELAKEIDPIRAKRRSGHFRQMAEVAEDILGYMTDLKYVGEDEYEWVRLEPGPVTVDRRELIQDLKTNIEKVRQKYRALDLFEHFLQHLEAEEPSCKELEQYIEAYPWELVKLLKLLVSKGEFKGKCPVCEGWY